MQPNHTNPQPHHYLKTLHNQNLYQMVKLLIHKIPPQHPNSLHNPHPHPVKFP